jgi:hypothetical protein
LKHKLYAVQRATDVSKLEIMKMVHLWLLRSILWVIVNVLIKLLSYYENV